MATLSQSENSEVQNPEFLQLVSSFYIEGIIDE
jgi:hypothetical protein